jgi:DNA invertase Pin-like site-specific DNA recombinase
MPFTEQIINWSFIVNISWLPQNFLCDIMENMKYVAIYCRVSTERQESEGYSLDEQIRSGKEFAQRLAMPFELYREAISGKTPDRTEFQRFLKDVEENKVAILWLKALDRFSRKMKDASMAISLMEDHNVRLFEGNKEYDLNEDGDQMTIMIKFVMAQQEGRKISKRTLDGLKEQIDAGERRRNYPYGYTFEYDKGTGKKIWAIDPEEARIVNFIYDQYISGKTSVEIAKILNNQKIRTKTYGKQWKNDTKYKKTTYNQWEAPTILSLLRNTIFIGKTKNTKGKLIDSVYYNRIVTDLQWEKVSRILCDDITPRFGRVFRPASTMLSGVVVCGKCGTRYFRSTKNGKSILKHRLALDYQKNCNQHPKSFYMDYVAEIVELIFITFFKDGENLNRYVEFQKSTLMKNQASIFSSIEKIGFEKKNWEKSKRELIDGIARYGLKWDDIDDQMKEIEKNLKTLNEEQGYLELQISDKEKSTREIINRFTQETLGEFMHGNEIVKRKILLTMTNISIMDDEIIIVFKGGYEQRFHYKRYETAYLPKSDGTVESKEIDTKPEFRNIDKDIDKLIQKREAMDEWKKSVPDFDL